MRKYMLEIVAVHAQNQRIYMSKGEHKTEDFLKALGEYGEDTSKFTAPEYRVVKKIPTQKDSDYSYLLSFVEEGVRGSFPATYVWEKY